jgi:hypothetical protein
VVCGGQRPVQVYDCFAQALIRLRGRPLFAELGVADTEHPVQLALQPGVRRGGGQRRVQVRGARAQYVQVQRGPAGRPPGPGAVLIDAKQAGRLRQAGAGEPQHFLVGFRRVTVPRLLVARVPGPGPALLCRRQLLPQLAQSLEFRARGLVLRAGRIARRGGELGVAGKEPLEGVG